MPRMFSGTNTMAAYGLATGYSKHSLQDAEALLSREKWPVCATCGEDFVVVNTDSVGLCIGCAVAHLEGRVG